MQDTNVESRHETQQIDAPVRATKMQSSFNEAEYQRWCEKLRNRSRSKDNK
jgi:hypothetical protein